MPTIFKHPVSLGTQTFNDPSAKPDGAVTWIIDVLDGWKDTPEPQVRSTPLGASQDGSSSADFFPYESRFITIGGAVYATDEAAAEALHDLIVRDVVPRNKDLFLSRDEAVPKFVTCRRSAAVETEWVMPNGFRWQTTVQCDDPLKYSPSIVSGSAGVASGLTYYRTYPRIYPLSYTISGSGDTSSVGINNAGTAATSQIYVSITGPLPANAWRLRNDTNNGEFSVNVGLGTTDSLEISFATQTVKLNGYEIAYQLQGDFWKMDPGTNIIRLYADYNAASTFTVVARSAWE